jgi:transposase
VEPLIAPAKRGGNKRAVDVREVVNGLMYVLRHRLPMAGDPEGPAAAQHGARLF